MRRLRDSFDYAAQTTATTPHTSAKGRVSVIMPFLNLERFIAESIESVLAQTYDHWELLLVDDGSTDGSTEIARRYAERFPECIRYFEHEGHTNRGASASRNVGFRYARGEYLALLDGDDVWLPTKLARQVPLLDALPEAGALYGNTLYWYSWTGHPEDQVHDYLPELGFAPGTLIAPPNLLVRSLRRRAAVPCTCSLLLRRTVVEAVGGFEEEFTYIFTDQAFYAKLFLRTPVYVIEDCLDKYRRHPDSACSIVESRGEVESKRRDYLQWVARYLTAMGMEDSKVWRAVRYELWRHKHPLISYPLDMIEGVRGRIEALARRVRDRDRSS